MFSIKVILLVVVEGGHLIGLMKMFFSKKMLGLKVEHLQIFTLS